ncbi:MAG: murein biosynthesis integral membrane protein MurJ [Spirochaetae bacterium HGW-Spirochaetae-9]|nr:MAG: murein biosynthesis integral membrane protein MurJ [Spirochaetae bacterium HGW-Spirochaetae-9]
MQSTDDKKMVRDAGMLSVLTMISRVLGLVREMTKASFLGTGMLSDAFSVSFMIPNFMRRLFAENSISVAFIPTFKDYLHAEDEKATRQFLSASLTVLSLLVSSVVALGIALAPWIVRAFGSDPVETAVLTRMMFPFLALVSIAALFQGILNSYGIFAPSGFAPILFNVCFIIVPWAVSRWMPNPARAMAVGVVLGGMAQALWQLPAVMRTGSKFGFISPALAFRDPGMLKVFALIGPTILGMAAYQINDLVSTAFASRAGTGIASSLTYSIRLQELILGVFAVSAGTVLLPRLADAVKKGEWASYTSGLGRTLRSLSLTTIPVAVFSMITGREIVTLLFKRGDFTAESVALTASAFFWHQTGLAFIAANRVISPAFYARSDSKTPAFAGIASFAVNIGLVALLASRYKGPGIALSLSLSSLVNTIILVMALHKRRTEGMDAALAGAGRYGCKLFAFSLVAAIPVMLVRKPLLAAFAESGSNLAQVGIPFLVMTLIFALVGLSLLILTKDETAATLASHFGRKGRGRS